MTHHHGTPAREPSRQEILETITAPSDLDAMEAVALKEFKELLGIDFAAAGWHADRWLRGDVEIVATGLTEVRQVVAQWLNDRVLPDDRQTARVFVLVSLEHVLGVLLKDAADDTAEQQVELWRHVSHRALTPFRNGPLMLLALSAWRSGQQVLADLAVEHLHDQELHPYPSLEMMVADITETRPRAVKTENMPTPDR